MQVISTLWTHSFFSKFVFFCPSGYQRKTTKNPKSSKALLLHLGIEIFYTAAPEIYFHHQVSAARYWAHSHIRSCNLFATASTSLPVARSPSGPATRGGIKSSPLPPPCQHVDSTTQHNSKTSLTFLQVGISNIKEWSCFRQQGR